MANVKLKLMMRKKNKNSLQRNLWWRNERICRGFYQYCRTAQKNIVPINFAHTQSNHGKKTKMKQKNNNVIFLAISLKCYQYLVLNFYLFRHEHCQILNKHKQKKTNIRTTRKPGNTSTLKELRHSTCAFSQNIDVNAPNFALQKKMLRKFNGISLVAFCKHKQIHISVSRLQKKW